jgi:hypothetical protein
MCNSEEHKIILSNDLINDSKTLRQIEFLESKTKEITLQITRLEDEVEREISIKQSIPFLDQLAERICQVESFITDRFPQYKSHIVGSNEEPSNDDGK